MRSLRRWKAGLVLGSLVGHATCSAVLPAQPIITPKPEVEEALLERQIPDPISFAQLLLTAIPQSLRQIAATNAPAVSSILWEEFLDDKRPQWFLDLPWEIQSYLIRTFGPSTAYLPPSPTRSGVQVTAPESVWSWPTGTDGPQTSQSIYSPSFAQPSSSLRPSRSGLQTISSRPTSSLHTTRVSSSKFATSTATSADTSSNIDTTRSASLGSASEEPAVPPVSNAGLSKDQKIGLGVGIPLGIIGAAALLLGCCFLLRRRRNRRVNGTEPPSSPGFIPRFAFQDKSTDNIEHRRPLNPPQNQPDRDLGTFDWEDDGIDPFEMHNPDTSYRGHTIPPAGAPPSGVPAPPSMAMHDTAPIMAPALYHTHSSNRARGKRTSYSSLHSVAELSEPDENAESPVLGRNITPLERKRRPSMPMVLEIPPTIASNNSSIKRKPVPTSPQASNPAADLASQSLLRPPMHQPEHSGSSSSGLALSTNSSTFANPDYSTTSPISPLSENSLPFSSRSSQALPKTNPFSNDYSYVEDYGPEYNAGYVDVNDGLYGGHTSLSRYPDPSTSPTSARRSSKTDWPLRNLSLGRKREKSPLWDRVYESP